MAVTGIGVRIGLEGGKEFTEGLRGAAQEVKAYVAELKKAEGIKDPFDKASQSITTLGNAIEAQKDVVKGWRDQLDMAVNRFGEFSPEAARFREELSKSETVLQNLENQLSKLSNLKVELPGLGTFKRDLETMSQAVSTFQSEFSRYENMTGLSTAFTRASGMKDSLTSEIKAQQEVVKLLSEDYEKAVREQGEFSQSALELREKVANATKELEGMERTLRDLPNGLMVASDEIKKVGEKLESVGGKITSVGKSFAPVSGAAATGLTAIAKNSVDYEAAMKRVEAVLSVTATSADDLARQMELIDQTIMGMESIYSKSEIAAGMEDIARAGFQGDDAVKALNATLNVATIEQMDMSAAATGLAQALKQFGDGASEADRYADVLAATSAASATNVTELLQAMSQAAPAAHSVGAEVEDVALLLGLMANNGVVASRSGTAVKNMFANLIKPTDKAYEQLDKFNLSLFDSEQNLRPIPEVIANIRSSFNGLNVSIEDISDDILESEEAWEAYTASLPTSDQERLAAIVEIFGKRALPGVLAVINTGVKEYNDLASAIDGSAGAATQMSDVISSSTEGEWKKFVNEVKALAIEFGDVLLPVLKDLIAMAKEFISKFRGMDEGTQKMIVKALALTAAVSPVVTTVGKVTSGVGSLIKTGGSVAKGIGWVVKKISGTGGMTSSLASMSTAITGGGGAVSAMGSLGSAIGSGAAGVVGKLGGLATAAAPFLVKGAIVAGVVAGTVYLGKKIYDNWDSISDTLHWTWQGIKDSAAYAWDGIKNTVGGAATAISETVGGAFHGVKEGVVNAWNGITGAIGSAAHAVGETVTGAFGSMRDGIVRGWEGITDAVGGAVNWIGEKASGAFHGIYNTASDIFHGIKDTVGGAASWVGEKMSDAFEGIKWTASDVFEGVKSTVGGAVSWIGDKASSIGSTVVEAFSGMGSAIKTGFEGVTSHIGGAVDWIGQKVSGVFDGMYNAISNAWSKITGLLKSLASGLGDLASGAWEGIKNVAGGAWDLISDVASGAWNWGKDMVTNIGGGIAYGVGFVKESVSNVANTIWGWLHHSTPEEGPLKDDDEWMPDMMRQFAQGIEDNSELLSIAAEEAGMEIAVMKETAEQNISEAGVEMQRLTRAIADVTVAQFGYTKDEATRRIEQLKDETHATMNEMNRLTTAEVSKMSSDVEERVRGMQVEIQTLTDAIKIDTIRHFGITKEQAIERIKQLKDESTQAMEQMQRSVSDSASTMRTEVGRSVQTMRDAVTWYSEQANKNATGEMRTMVNTVDSDVSGLARNMSGYGQSMNDNLSGGMNQTEWKPKNQAQSTGNAIRETFTGLVSQAVTWGADLGSSIAYGLRTMLPEVRSATEGVANTISGMLHHTTPDFGPLKDDDKWMPDMMKNFASGITSNLGLVKSAAKKTAVILAGSRQYAYIPDGGVSSTMNMGGVNFTINAQPGQDVNEIAEAVEQRLIRMVERQQYAFS